MSTWSQDRAFAKELTDDQLVAALYELRDRGHAAPCYGAGEFASMFDGELAEDFNLDGFMVEHREALEEAMCETAREYFLREAAEAFEEEDEG